MAGEENRGAPQPVRLGDLLPSELLAPRSTPSTPVDRLISRLDERETHRTDREFYSELSTNRYPFASLWSKDTGRPGSIVVRRAVAAGASESDFEWIVTSGDPVKTHYGEMVGGLPGPSDRRVFRALEKIVLGRTIRKGDPLTNPQAVDTKEILDTLRITDQGKNYRMVVRALTRLASLTIHCSGMVSLKGRKPGAAARGKAQGIIFRLIDVVRWAGTVDPKDGLLVPATRIYFGEAYLERVNAFDVRPMDWDLWLALDARPLAQRLYEILELRFFGLKDSPYVSFTYGDLCQLLPTRPQRKPLAMQVLDKAHRALKEVVVERDGTKERIPLLDRVEWRWDGPDGTLRYFPDREYLRRLQARKTPEFDPRALELAREFSDLDSLGFYQRVVRNVDWSYINAARSEVRSNRRVVSPSRYFTATLEKILRSVGAPVPFGGNRE
jgi:hypothetical protein